MSCAISIEIHVFEEDCVFPYIHHGQCKIECHWGMKPCPHKCGEGEMVCLYHDGIPIEIETEKKKYSDIIRYHNNYEGYNRWYDTIIIPKEGEVKIRNLATGKYLNPDNAGVYVNGEIGTGTPQGDEEELIGIEAKKCEDDYDLVIDPEGITINIDADDMDGSISFSIIESDGTTIHHIELPSDKRYKLKLPKGSRWIEFAEREEIVEGKWYDLQFPY